MEQRSVRARLGRGTALAVATAILAWVAEARVGWTQPQPAPVRTATQDAAERLQDARGLFAAADWERAIGLLNGLITDTASARDSGTRGILGQALELRARVRFNLGDAAGATADFTTLLGTFPDHQLSADVSPRVATAFDEVKKLVVGYLELQIEPPEAAVELDGLPLEVRVGPISVTAGVHTVTAAHRGYRSAAERFAVAPSATSFVTLTLVRTTATITLRTVPSDVEVILDGVSRGRTESPGGRASPPGPPVLYEGLPPEASRPFVIEDLAATEYRLEFRKPCHHPYSRAVTMRELGDVALDPIVLTPATGRILVEVPEHGTLYVDGVPAGQSPVTLDAVCEGSRVVEVRAPAGRLARRIDVRPGTSQTLEGHIAPAIALVSASTEGLAGEAVLRVEVERALARVRSLTLVAPDPDLLPKEALPPVSALGLGTAVVDKGSVEARVTFSNRREWSTRLARHLQTQGVAVVVGSDRPGALVRLAIFAAESAEPDLVDLDLSESSRLATRLDEAWPLYRRSLGFSTADVLEGSRAEVTRVVVTRVTSAQASGVIAAGEVITAVEGQPVRETRDLLAAVAARGDKATLSLAVEDRQGRSRTVPVDIVREPRLVDPEDRTRLFNRLIIEMRFRLTELTDPLERALASVNLGAALMATSNWTESREVLANVRLPERAGISQGTVLYLLAQCHLALDRQADAVAALESAARDAGALLTEDGPAIADLAKRQLAVLRTQP